jgi:hypothetical protein
MIDEARTLELFGYTSDSLTHGSGKKVCAVCDECGEVRILEYKSYRSLCYKCGTPRGDNHPTYGKKLSDEHKRKISDSLTGNKLSDETKQKLSEAFKGRNFSEDTRRKLSEAGKKRICTDETKDKISKANRGQRAGSDNARYGKHCSEETKKKISDATKGKHIGTNHYNWQGGISFEPYCPKFNEAFKESIREKFGRVCFLCPKTEVENGKKLCVHHVDYDKNCLCDGVNCEFVPLCASCHSKTNHNREYWENLIMEKLKTETFNNDGG